MSVVRISFGIAVGFAANASVLGCALVPATGGNNLVVSPKMDEGILDFFGICANLRFNFFCSPSLDW